MMAEALYDKLRGQRMLLTKWIKVHNATDDPGERERAAHKLANVLAWAQSVGMSPPAVIEDRELPHRAIELFEAGAGVGQPINDSELREATKEIERSVVTANVDRVGEGAGSVYVYGYECVSGRLKTGRTDGDVIRRIVNQINESTPDRPILHLVLATDSPGELERALHGALALRQRKVDGGGKEWYRTNVAEILEIYNALLGTPAHSSESDSADEN